MMDLLAVWERESGWAEMAQIGMCIMLAYAAHPELDVRKVSMLAGLSNCRIVASACNNGFKTSNKQNPSSTVKVCKLLDCLASKALYILKCIILCRFH